MNPDNYQYVKINGVSIAYTDSGQKNGQTVLLVHGFASFSFTWKRLLEPFPKIYVSSVLTLKDMAIQRRFVMTNYPHLNNPVYLTDLLKNLT